MWEILSMGSRLWSTDFSHDLDRLVLGCRAVYTFKEKAVATHSSILAWKIPWTEEPGQAAVHGVTRSQTLLHFHFHFSLSCIGERNGNPLQYSCLENLRDRGAW